MLKAENLKLRWLLALLAAGQLFSVSAFSTTVRFSLADLNLTTATNRKCLIGPLDAPLAAGGKMILKDTVAKTTDSAGIFYVSNMVAQTYAVQVLAPPSLTTFYIEVTNSASVLEAHDLQVETPAPATVTYTKAQLDAMFAAISTGSGTVSNVGPNLSLSSGTIYLAPAWTNSLLRTNDLAGRFPVGLDDEQSGFLNAYGFTVIGVDTNSEPFMEGTLPGDPDSFAVGRIGFDVNGNPRISGGLTVLGSLTATNLPTTNNFITAVQADAASTNAQNAAKGFTQASTNNSITLNNVVRRWNVMNYGASGTGDYTLDSPAFATAWSNAFKFGGVVYAPKGLYTDTNSYNPIPVYATNAGLYHTAQTGSELFLEGDGKDASIIQVAITNAVYMWCAGQIPGLKGVGFVNVGGGSNDCLIATNTPGVAGLISDCRWDGFRTRYSQAVNIAAMDGLRVRGCEWRDNYIGIRVGGYSDGCEVDGRADACRVGLVIGGYVGGTSVTRALGNRINLSGNGNGYHIVVGASSACNVLSGYSEGATNALVAMGYPSGVFIDESATGSGTTTMLGLQQGVATSTDVFCQLFVKPTGLQIIGCSGGNAVVSAAAGADATPIQIIGGLWFGTNLITLSTGGGVPHTGSWTEWSYNWNSINTFGIASNTWDMAGFYYGHNGQFGVLKANTSWFTNDINAFGKIVQNDNIARFTNSTGSYIEINAAANTISGVSNGVTKWSINTTNGASSFLGRHDLLPPSTGNWTNLNIISPTGNNGQSRIRFSANTAPGSYGSSYIMYDRGVSWGTMLTIGNTAASAGGDLPSAVVTIDGANQNNFVGIGTALPTAKLHVSGDILATQSILATNPAVASHPFVRLGTNGTVTAKTVDESNVHLIDHFIGGQANANPDVGELGWTYGGTAPAKYAESSASPQRFGILKLATGTGGSNTSSYVFFHNLSQVPALGYTMSNWVSKFTFKLADTNIANFWLGVGNSAAVPQYYNSMGNGFWCFVTNGNAGQYFTFQNRASTGDSSPWVSNSTVRVDTNWHVFTLSFPGDGTGAHYSIDGEPDVTINGNWPVASGTPEAAVVTGDGVTKALWVDKWELIATP